MKRLREGDEENRKQSKVRDSDERKSDVDLKWALSEEKKKNVWNRG